MSLEMLEKIQIPTSVSELPRHPNVGFEKFFEALGEGRLRAGATHTQAQLCEQLDISLSPLRETLVLLEEYGLIDIKQRSGITIINPELSFVRENYQFRILIELEALKAFVGNVPDGWMEAVRDRHKDVMSNLDTAKPTTKTISAFIALDQFFHFSLVSALKNKSILSTHTRLQQNIRMVRAMHKTSAYTNNLMDAAREHLELLDHIENEDLDHASQCIRRHFESSIFRVVVNP